jgi:hypothetical protein
MSDSNLTDKIPKTITKGVKNFFEMLSFRSKPKYEKFNNNDNYEFIILNEKKL